MAVQDGQRLDNIWGGDIGCLLHRIMIENDVIGLSKHIYHTDINDKTYRIVLLI